MIGMYLDTLIIGHTSSNMLSILNKLTLQKELQNCLTKNSDLKILGLYLDTLKIGHTYCNMLSILNKLTLQNELQNCVT